MAQKLRTRLGMTRLFLAGYGLEVPLSVAGGGFFDPDGGSVHVPVAAATTQAARPIDLAPAGIATVDNEELHTGPAA